MYSCLVANHGDFSMYWLVPTHMYLPLQWQPSALHTLTYIHDSHLLSYNIYVGSYLGIVIWK
jgi:hypothetical protein